MTAIALRDLIGVPGGRARVPTPALLVDADALDANIAHMAARAYAAGVALRPHAKSHKSARVAALQVAAGAVGVCCAKLGEAEALAGAGVRDILVTSPVATPALAARAVALAHAIRSGAAGGLAVVVDHPAGVAALADAAAVGDMALDVLIDVDVGQGRTGVVDPAAAVALAARIAAAPGLRLAGVQGYGGNQQHVAGSAARAAAVAAGTTRLATVVTALRAAGHTVERITGGGTGSFAADAALGVLTEVQPGSYVFMDEQYRAALGDTGDGGFATSLFVAATVISVNQPGWVTVDAGLKAFATDAGVPRAVTPRFAGCAYTWFGDEHGKLARPAGAPVVPGERVEFAVPHCDPTVDRYSAFVFVRGDTVVDVVPIDAARASQ